MGFLHATEMAYAGNTTCSAPHGLPISSVLMHTGVTLAVTGVIVPLSPFCLRAKSCVGKKQRAGPTNTKQTSRFPSANSVSASIRVS